MNARQTVEQWMVALDRGGVIRWIHHEPQGRHLAGSLRHGGWAGQ